MVNSKKRCNLHIENKRQKINSFFNKKNHSKNLIKYNYTQKTKTIKRIGKKRQTNKYFQQDFYENLHFENKIQQQGHIARAHRLGSL